MRYVQLKRMELAKRLLSGSKFSIGGIAEEVGMELAHFSKVFKKTTGVSPSAYRSSTR
ncbi:DNA-binding transcriptional regulator AraC [compost metagenome]